MSAAAAQAEDFATELRASTRRHHRASDALVGLAAPLALSSPAVYRLVLASFYRVYHALEDELARRRHLHPKVGRVYYPALLRARAFERDLAFYFADEPLPPPSAATRAHVAELRAAVREDPVVLVAYSQTLYMALLAGGAALDKWVRVAFGVGDEGTRIFNFRDTISNVPQFRKQYNETLNSIALTRQQKDAIIERKKRIFELNDAIFSELRQTAAYRTRVLAVVMRVLAVFALAALLVRVLQSNSAWLQRALTLGAGEGK